MFFGAVKLMLLDKPHVITANQSHSKYAKEFMIGDIVVIQDHVVIKNGKKVKHKFDLRNLRMFESMKFEEFKPKQKLIDKAFAWGCERFGELAPSKLEILDDVQKSGRDAFKSVARLAAINEHHNKKALG